MEIEVVLAQRKMKGKELAQAVGITEQNLSLLKSGKVKGVQFEALAKICEVLGGQPGNLLEAVPKRYGCPKKIWSSRKDKTADHREVWSAAL